MTDSPADLSLAADFEPADRDAWLALVNKVLKGADFAKRLVCRTADGIDIAPLYTRADALPDCAAGRPGEAPYTRGRTADPRRLDIRQLVADGDAKAANAAMLADLEGGAASVLIRAAAPGQAGLPMTPDSLAAALAGVEIGAITVAVEPGAAARDALAVVSSIWSARGLPPAELLLALGADPIGVMATTGTEALRVEDAVALLRAPGLDISTASTLLAADGRTAHEALGSEAQEIAFAATSLIAYLKAGAAIGLSPADVIARTELKLAADADMFATMAKLRAARRVIWRVAQACGVADAAARMPLAVTTSARMGTRRDPWVNLLRATTATTAAILGGADAVTVLPFTWALGQPDAFARRIARNTAIILDEESGLTRVADPAGGAWYLERLTDALAHKAWDALQEIEGEGGIRAALTSGLIQDQIAAVAEERAKQIATLRQPLTGTSAFPLLGADGVDAIPHVAPPPIPATPTIRTLSPRRLAEPFEKLRDRADQAKAKGKRLDVFLACLGPKAEHGARAQWIQNYLASAGIASISSEDLTNSADAGAQFAASGAAIACICGTDTTYAELGEATAMALGGAGAAAVLLAGRPGDLEAALTAAGVSRYLFAGQNAVAALSEVLDLLEA